MNVTGPHRVASAVRESPGAVPPCSSLFERMCATDTNHGAVRDAYDFTVERHRGQCRASGDAYASHPVEVAGILADLKLDTASIVTGLLHDTVEDGVATRGEIEARFGAEIGSLVDGVTKLGKIKLQSHSRRQAENFQKFLLAISEDIRVLLVKLADRLHNMRTLRFLESREKRLRIARETVEIYAPLAERIGMQRFKTELEDLAFVETNPEARESLCNRLRFLQDTEGRLVPIISGELRDTLQKAGVDAVVDGRIKQPYSIWRKMEKKHALFEQIADVIAFRVIVVDTPGCYQALGAVHGAYPMVPERFKDYISTPKLNNYRSLHTAVIGPQQRRIEVQIRTRDMHEVAEYGAAAHWLYKQKSAGPGAGREHHDPRLRALRDIVEHAADAEEVLEHTKLEMYTDQVFCFTPRGELVSLPHGATPVDFAYAVHSDVGDTCVGAKINGRLAPLQTILNNGDQVEILRSSVPAPSPSWESFVATGKARSRIRRFIRQNDEIEHAAPRARHSGKDISSPPTAFRRRGSGRGHGPLSLQQAARAVCRREPVQAGGGRCPARAPPGPQDRDRGFAANRQAGKRRCRRGGADPRPDLRRGGAHGGVLPSAARRPDRRHHDRGTRRHRAHHRLRGAGEFHQYARTLA